MYPRQRAGRGPAAPRARRGRRRRPSPLPLLAAGLILGSCLGWALRGNLPIRAVKPPDSSAGASAGPAGPSGAVSPPLSDREHQTYFEQLGDLSDYPDELLELLLRNPETLSYVQEYPEHKDDPPATDVGPVTLGQFPLLIQWDARWGYTQYGDGMLGLTGCAPTVLSMAICGLTGDNTQTPNVVAAYAQAAGYYVDGVGSSWTLISEGCGHFGLNARELPLAYNTMVRALEDGQPIVCSVRAGDFTTSGHFILITGVENGKFQVNDPNRHANSEQLWDYDRLSPQISNLWALTAKGKY